MAGPAGRSTPVDAVAEEAARIAPAHGAFLPRHPCRGCVMAERFGPLVDAGWLREDLHGPDIRVIDFRWYLQGRNGRHEYERSHIPGAVFVDLESITGKEGAGRHPLPTAAQFEREMCKAGIGPTTSVVVYDDTGGSVAARLWFLLGY